MKSCLLLLSFFFFHSFIAAQTWSWSTDHPKPGEDVVVTIKGLEIEEDIHIVGLYFRDQKLASSDINYIVENDALKLTFKVPEQTNWLRIVIRDENNQPVAGDHRDIAQAGAPPASSLMEYANATAAFYRVMGITRDESVATKMYRDAIAANPAWRENPKVLWQYYANAKAAKAEEDLKMIGSYINSCEAAPSPSQDLLVSSIRIAKESGDSVLVKSLRRKLDTLYPQSLLTQEDDFMMFKNASALADKIILRDKFRATYPVNEFNRGMHDQITSSVVQGCAEMEEWDKVENYINEIVDPSTKANVCNNYAWTLVGEGLENKPKQLDVAARLSATSLEALAARERPLYFTETEWVKTQDASQSMYGDTYALILYKQGKYDDALQYQGKAVTGSKYQELEINERYALYLEKAGKSEEALSFIEDMLKAGTATSAMKQSHERIWTQDRSKEQLYDRYITELESGPKAKRLAEIQAMWQDSPSTPFTLKNLDGKTVSLADYKGKIVVLDFWATWCGPCKSSFPGMKNAVEHYAADKDVVFLFIDTWESGNDIQGKVSKFITDHKYPFHVLMDIENKTVAGYKVEGIPTKFIIDGDQRIRFKSVGYGGNNEVLVEELITMIEMAKNNGKVTKT